MVVLIPVLVLAAIAALCAVLLTVADKYFGVPVDEKEAAVRDCLPGANCGACGYSGCDGYAKALAEGKTDAPNLCVPGGEGAAQDIAAILGVEATDVDIKVAYVACNGVCEASKQKFEYVGVKSCKIANMSYNGQKMCNYACLGFGDCASICPQNAISIVDGVARVDRELCIGCGMCSRICPNGIIKMISEDKKVKVVCSNHDKGAVTRKACTNGCIGCGKCQKTCQFGAIKVEHNLAVIDYNKCTGCGACAEACPVKCIKTLSGGV